MFMIFTLLFAAAAAMIAAAAPAPARDLRTRGGIVDGSGWEGVYNVLRKDGFNVGLVQKPVASRWRLLSSPQTTSKCCG
jgi:hypothetical protein